MLVAVTIILAPWWIRLVRGLAHERAERIRSQERAEVAAHLHDSVLQTLALVQKRADDPREVAALARRQERELRAWLNNTRPAGTATLAGALEAAAAEVEADHHVPIEVVTVGDGPLDERADRAGRRRARGARERVASSPGPEPISLYAEVENGRAEVFVRDRGPGFDPEEAAKDRRGVRDSIIGRMERHGGRATVHSTPGTGTEVELVMDHDQRRDRRRPLALPRGRASPSSTGSWTSWATRPTVEEAVERIVELEPDVVLLDVHMPGGGGLEVIRQVGEKRPAQRFLALSVSDAPEDVIAIIRAGARGYVTKTISGTELADAVRRIADGDAVFSPRLAGLRARRVRHAHARPRSTRSSTS